MRHLPNTTRGLLSAQPAEGNNLLNIRIDEMGNRRPVYTSVTDLYEVDILTAESAERESQYRELVALRRQEELEGLFAGEATEPLSQEAYIQVRATELGLFLEEDSRQVFHRPQGEGAEYTPSTWLVAVVIGVLCVGAFLFSNWRHRRKKRRDQDVHHSDNPRVRQGV